MLRVRTNHTIAAAGLLGMSYSLAAAWRLPATSVSDREFETDARESCRELPHLCAVGARNSCDPGPAWFR